MAVLEEASLKMRTKPLPKAQSVSSNVMHYC